MAQTQPTRRIPQWTQPERLRKARKDAGLSVNKIAELVDRKPQTISAWENGTRFPNQRQLEMWADACEVDLIWLTFGVAFGSGGVSSTVTLPQPLSPAGQMAFPIALEVAA